MFGSQFQARGVSLKTLCNLIFLALIFIFAGCKQASQHRPNVTDVALPEDLVITLERGYCYGSCPVYKVIVFADGVTVFEGNNFVKELKVIRTQISQEQVKRLLQEFDSAKIFSKRDDYLSQGEYCPEMWTDGFITTISIQANKKIKLIQHYDGCRGATDVEELTRLENKVDEIINTNQWIGTREERQWRQLPYAKDNHKKNQK